jgi:hypothetical protein
MSATKTATKATKKTKTEAKAYEHKARVASFNVEGQGPTRVFRPVNKRAHKLALKVGKRTKVTADHLKEFDGYYLLRQYTNKGVLKPIKL